MKITSLKKFLSLKKGEVVINRQTNSAGLFTAILVVKLQDQTYFIGHGTGSTQGCAFGRAKRKMTMTMESEVKKLKT